MRIIIPFEICFVQYMGTILPCDIIRTCWNKELTAESVNQRKKNC